MGGWYFTPAIPLDFWINSWKIKSLWLVTGHFLPLEVTLEPNHSWLAILPPKKSSPTYPDQLFEKLPGDSMTVTLFIPKRWRSPFQPFQKGHVFTIPKRSRSQNCQLIIFPGTSFHRRHVVASTRFFTTSWSRFGCLCRWSRFGKFLAFSWKTFGFNFYPSSSWRKRPWKVLGVIIQVPRKHRKVPHLGWGNWMAGFRGVDMESSRHPPHFGWEIPAVLRLLCMAKK